MVSRMICKLFSHSFQNFLKDPKRLVAGLNHPLQLSSLSLLSCESSVLFSCSWRSSNFLFCIPLGALDWALRLECSILFIKKKKKFFFPGTLLLSSYFQVRECSSGFTRHFWKMTVTSIKCKMLHVCYMSSHLPTSVRSLFDLSLGLIAPRHMLWSRVFLPTKWTQVSVSLFWAPKKSTSLCLWTKGRRLLISFMMLPWGNPELHKMLTDVVILLMNISQIYHLYYLFSYLFLFL